MATESSTVYSLSDDPVEAYLHKYRITIAATTAAVSCVVVGFPFDSVKTRMQAFRYKSMNDCVAHTYRTEGVLGFFRGMAPVLVTVSALRSLSFTVYTSSKIYLNDKLAPYALPPWANLTASTFLSGAFVGSVVATLNSPIEYVKLHVQLERLLANETKGEISRFPGTTTTNIDTPLARSDPPPPKRSSWGMAKHIVNKKGFFGLYAGYRLHLTRDILGTSMYFCGYENIKRLFELTLESGKCGPVHHMLAGGIAGTSSWLILFPIDLVKSNVQKEALKDKPRFSTTAEFVRLKWAKGDMWGFYRGIGPQLVRSFPIHALNFLVYEQVLDWCTKRDIL
ncbi:mitochondrial carrier domain-containing protein [Polychytrium aggregatum]|uniref:mitochondrial carrier domain-containing protein n=1 Tax=Polychytrium aggregatum TaxID=110093 RepID=UPI0022FEFE38|nr:mitochondrial carrier domain-containing protein [Polychytrium aggregatum]KAI9207473.1 mitochondrial carrier domain-containing protein [Polychytrium aggregatum]